MKLDPGDQVMNIIVTTAMARCTSRTAYRCSLYSVVLAVIGLILVFSAGAIWANYFIGGTFALISLNLYLGLRAKQLDRYADKLVEELATEARKSQENVI